MKKLLFLALLLIAGRVSFGQAGGLTIQNKNTTCGVYVTMYADDIPGGFPHCTLMSNQIYLPPSPLPGCTVTYPSHGAFSSTVGWFSGGTPPSTSQTFRWNETQFQFNCPIGMGCSNGGAYVSPLNAARCSIAQNNIFSAGGCVGPINWNPNITLTMSNVTVTFN